MDRLKSTRRIRVLHVVLNLHGGGLERLVADILQRTDRSRFESHLLALQFLGRHGQEVRALAPTHLAGALGTLSMLWPRGLARQIQDIAPDVVHTHSGVWYKASLAARIARVPRVVHTDHGRHEPDPWLDRMADRIAAHRTDTVVAVSSPLCDQLRGKIVTEPTRLRVIRNGIDTERYQPHADDGVLRGELRVPLGSAIIATVGRLDRVKAHKVMLLAFKDLLAQWDAPLPPVLLVIGDGPERDALEARVAQLELGGTVRFLGWRTDVARVCRAFTVFTLSSRSEGTSVALLEAMASGLCPVVTDVGGNRDVLGPDLSHRLTPVDDYQALARAWHAALHDASARQADARLARRRVETTFDLEAMVRAYEDLYQSLLL